MKVGLKYTILWSLISVFCSQSFAADSPVFKVNPESIRHQVLENNLSLITAQKQVQDAKDTVSLARTHLLPSVNLSGLLTVTNGPTFILSSVQFLLPFLFPSNWFNLKQEKNLYEAERVSYLILELNTYGSALSLYYSILRDQQYRDVYIQQAKDLQQIADILTEERKDFGIVSLADQEHALAQAQMSQIQASTLSELSKQELAAFRSALNISLDKELVLDPSPILPASTWESRPVQDTVAQAKLVAPELTQIGFLVQAAINARRSTLFSFLGGGSMAPTTTTGSPLSSLGVGGNVTIGASIFYNYRLSARYVQEVQDEAKQMDQLTTQIVESTVGSLQEAALQYDLGVQAEKEMQDVYESKREQYELGLCSFMTVLLARTQTSSASIARIQAMTDLDLLRTTLNRTLILDEFGKVNGCNPTSTGRHQTIDQVCHEGTPLPSST